MISYTIKISKKKFQNNCYSGESCFKFQMKCLNCRNFVTAHVFLTGWQLFIFFTVVPFLFAPLVILDFCFILVASNTVICASLFGAHRFNLKDEDFIIHVQYSPEKLSKLWHGNSCYAFRKKMLGFIFFLVLFSCSTYIVQKLTKTYPRRIYTFCLFLFSGGM